MKYFKMRESKRKISFIMALALIVSLLPVSPVVKAASGDPIKVYVVNEVEGTTEKVEKVDGNGKAVLTLSTIKEADQDTIDVKITASGSAISGTNDNTTSCSAIATGSATNSNVEFKKSYSNGTLTWEISGLTQDILLTITKTSSEEPDKTPEPTDPPSTEVVLGTMSPNNQKAILAAATLTPDEKAAVDAGTARLELKASDSLASVGAIAEDTKAVEAIKNLNVDSKTKSAIEKFLETPTQTFVFDIEMFINYVANNINKQVGQVNELAEEIEVEMKLPKVYQNKGNVSYFVVRLHTENGKTIADVIPCTVTGDKFKFKSNKFSKFMLCYKVNDSTGKPWYSVAGTPTPTPAPNASATPSASPSASAAPGASTTPTTAPAGTNKPDGSVDDGNNNPGVTEPGDGDTGDNEGNTSGSSSKVKKGQKYTVNGIKYEIISTDSTKTVGFVNGKKNSKKITIPATVKIKGKTFKVKSIKTGAFKNSKKLTTLVIGANVKIIEKNAFKGCKNLKKITIKSKKLTAAKVAKNAFKGINKKATVKVPKNKVKAYSKIVKVKGGAGNSVKVTK